MHGLGSLLLSNPWFVKFPFHLEINVPESEGRMDWHKSKLLEVQCEVSTVSDDLWSCVYQV